MATEIDVEWITAIRYHCGNCGVDVVFPKTTEGDEPNTCKYCETLAEEWVVAWKRARELRHMLRRVSGGSDLVQVKLIIDD